MIQTKNRGKYRILPGNPEKMGASATKDGYNFAVEVSDGKKAELLLYRKGHQKSVSYRAASGRGAHWRDQFRGNHRPDGRKVFVCLPDGRSFLLGSVCGSSRRKRNFGAPMEKEEAPAAAFSRSTR